MSIETNLAIEFSMGVSGFGLVTATSLTTGPFVAITTENETESVVTCSRLRPLDLATTVMTGGGFTAGGLPINLNPKGTRL